MNRIKKIIKYSSLSLLLFFTFSLIITIIGYFNLISDNVLTIIKFIFSIVCFGFAGFLMGMNSLKRGWLEGLYISLFLSFIMLIITILLCKFKIDYLLYILVLIISGIFGSMLGINKKVLN